MKYNSVVEGKFIERPNRFIAYVKIGNKTEKVHVKNTGRCRELLQPGVCVYLEKSDNPARSTAYDLIAVKKGDRLINMDSQAPNKAAGEWLAKGDYFGKPTLLRPETTYGSSRFDFYLETEKEKIFVEVKGVTLEEDGVVLFPDAPSERAVKHVEELIEAKKSGYRTAILFVIQMDRVQYFTPNRKMQKEFADALEKASRAGVEILAYDCVNTYDSMVIDKPVEVRLQPETAGNPAYIPAPLLAWYDENRRKLPWREIPTPYRVWVSEIMLQQTRVEAVKPYFERFMRTLPDIKSLAEADEDTLLKLWEGLGYYNRVRNLQKAAIQICELYGGEMPADYEKLLRLTGIGTYTAGAVASIAFGIPRPAVDGNVLRVLSRVRCDERLITDAKVKTAVEAELLPVMPADRPGDFNQAMMEIGACVCLPNGAPLCEKCPLVHLCKAHAAHAEQDYPKKESKKPRAIEEKTILIIRDAEKTAIRKRPAKGLLAGLYEFPSLDGYRTADEVVAFLKEQGIRTIRISPLEDCKHIFTHKEWHMKGYAVRVDELETPAPTDITADWIYAEPSQTEHQYPIPSAFAAYAAYLRMRQGKGAFEEE